MSRITDRIAIFYHVARMGNRWQTIDFEITRALQTSGLLERADMFIRNDCRDVKQYEFPTLNMLREFSVRADYAVLYLHTKGVTQDIPSVDDWRACMLYWLVERWQECLAKLAKFDAVGINHMSGPVRHFQGNFWWAKTTFLRTLGRPEDVRYKPTQLNQTERHKAEFWIGHKGFHAYEPYHHHIDPYCTRNPREKYEGRAFL